MVEKATAIHMGVIALGITTHIGVTPKLGGSPHVVGVLTRGLEDITGSTLIVEIDPKGLVKAMSTISGKRRSPLEFDKKRVRGVCFV